ncbi:hypothetical protein BJY21_000946 [Kineosphaera limosa]|uniref:Uncharacterized protein n=1 Tax=Kineosphaera limosa NBRC 100340 TaxID=1184609 RepID=K6WUV5_9MICO|nr:hypothetical protein [Kineosphaera limosa]NYD99761.1 hypothetical protein [Kineosphaera limosa]GAB95862.1 hypothetical protein KILIM_028_00160 [Kineosphaera limosa NBRC 100340]
MSNLEPGRPRRPSRLTPQMMEMFAAESLDPAVIIAVADESAAALVHAGRASDDPQVTQRLVTIVDEIGLSTLAQLWSQRPARSLPGLLWRLYVLREWVLRDPAGASADYTEGLRFADVDGVVAGAASPPGPQELQHLADEILRGVFDGDLGVALHRAGAFCRVVAAGRGAREEYGVDAASAPDAAAPDAAGPGVAGPGVAGPGVGAGLTSDPAAGPAGMGWSQELRRAAAMLTTAEDLEAGARRWRAGEFG